MTDFHIPKPKVSNLKSSQERSNKGDQSLLEAKKSKRKAIVERFLKKMGLRRIK